MSSRFKESLGFIKNLRNEIVYHSKSENGFEREYVEEPSFGIEEELFHNQELFCKVYPYLPNPLYNSFFNDLYAAFVFIYEIEGILDEIECNGLSFELSDALMEQCALLSVTSTHSMISVDDIFSFAKKYSLARDIYVMAKNIHDAMMLIHSVNDEDLSLKSPIALTDYDQLKSRLSCKYIRNGIAVLKLFHVLAILQTSPAYSDGVHQVAKMLIYLLREVLYDKRILKMVVDTDLYGSSSKPHKSTRLKIFFVMGNSDRYCIRLDFPHEGEESIHLNLNEPGHRQSTGFPFNDFHYEEVLEICGDMSLFKKLFYFYDDLYWFRHDFAVILKELKKNNSEQSHSLEEFHHEMSHIQLSSPDSENRNAIVEFTTAFAEAIADYQKQTIYGRTDSDDEDYFRYVLFEDYIFDTVMKIRSFKFRNTLRIGNHCFLKDVIHERIDEVETDVKSLFVDYINEKFPEDEELLELSELDIGLGGFFSKCLDHLEQVWSV